MIVERLPWCEPVEAAARLRPLGGLAYLDTARENPRFGRWSTVAADPFGCFTVEEGRAFWNGTALPGDPLVALRERLQAFSTPRDPASPPFTGGAIGTLAYEFAHTLERLPHAPAAPWGCTPQACLPFYDVVLAFDRQERAAWLCSSGAPERDPDRQAARARRRADRMLERLARSVPDDPAPIPIPRAAWQSNFSRERYAQAVAQTIEAILDGEIFQANIAQRFMAPLPPAFAPWAFYRRLRETNPAPFAAYLDQGERVVASSSPELFLALDGDRVETRPIKGTSPRATDPLEDRRLAERLATSDKDRAENLMIVDLLRNDLSRVCRPHSVKTPDLCVLESYAGVHHLVSSVTGRLRPGLDAVDLIAAAFPGGSVTGAPKLQAMRVITRTEREPRGIYCGSVVGLGFDGSLIGSIAIRTVLLQHGRAVFQAGGGVTALSDPQAEYQESLDKAERIFAAFEPAESLAGEAAA